MVSVLRARVGVPNAAGKQEISLSYSLPSSPSTNVTPASKLRCHCHDLVAMEAVSANMLLPATKSVYSEPLCISLAPLPLPVPQCNHQRPWLSPHLHHFHQSSLYLPSGPGRQRNGKASQAEGRGGERGSITLSPLKSPLHLFCRQHH